jgi:hypothetical protein
MDIAFSSGTAWLGGLMCMYVVYMVRPQHFVKMFAGLRPQVVDDEYEKAQN